MLTMAVILAVLSAWVEIKFVRRIKPINHIMVHGFLGIDAGLINLVFSISISLFLGTMFGVGGLIAFLGGLGSTALTNMYYPNETALKNMGTSLKAVPDKLVAAKNSANKVYGDFRQPVADFSKMVLVFLKIITTPVHWLRAASIWYSKRRATTTSF